MTPEQLAEIRARAEAATPGPWKLYDGWGPLKEDGKLRVLYVGAPGAKVLHDDEGHDLVATEDDFVFVAHARTDIPALLDYIEELQWVIRKVGDCVAHPEDTKEAGGTLCAQCMYLVDTLTSKEPTNA